MGFGNPGVKQIMTNPHVRLIQIFGMVHSPSHSDPHGGKRAQAESGTAAH
jgi:hypothetical protein